MNLPEGLIALLHQPSPCFVTTLMPDGSPQMTQTWADTGGEHVVINNVPLAGRARCGRAPR